MPVPDHGQFPFATNGDMRYDRHALLERYHVTEERRRAVRFQFIAPAELIDETSGARATTYVTDLSLHGCAVGVANPPREGTPVGLRILTDKHLFESQATVAHSTAHRMGLTFLDVKPNFLGVLNGWLAGAKFPKGRN
jgi:PilZ domain